MRARTITLIGIVCLVLLPALSTTAFASNIYTTEDMTATRYWMSDSQIGESYWHYGGRYYDTDLQVDRWVTDDSWFGYRYGYHWAVVQMPIDSLNGMQFAPGSVKLWFYSYGFAADKSVRGMNYDPRGWMTEEHVRWMSSHSSSTLVGSVPAGGAGWIGVDVTSQVQSQVNAGYGWAGFYIDGPPAIGTADRIGSSEGGYAAYLEIVPEPSSLIALMGGLAGMGFFLRRRR